MSNFIWQRAWADLSHGDEETCWPWPLVRDQEGYGKIGGRMAHRRAYETVCGPIPEGLQLDHVCRNRACVNPAHLEPVTPLENVRRGLKVALRTHCKHGHELTPENTYTQGGRRRECRTCVLHAQRRYQARKRLAA